MRERDFDVWVSLIREDATAAAIRESLALAAGALALASDGPYATAKAKEAVRSLQSAVADLDGTKPLREQRSQILPALRAAFEVLSAVRAAAPAVVTDAGEHDGPESGGR
jgi:surface antigen